MVTPMHREDIKAALRKRGYTLSDVAQRLKIDRSTVSGVLLGRRSERVEAEIASLIGMDLKDVWPERYGEQPS